MKLFPLLLILCTTLCSAQTDFWQKPTGPQHRHIDILARDSSGGIYAARNSSWIYHSTDEGRTWKETGATPGWISSIAVGSDGTIVATQSGGGSRSLQGLVLSDDRGRSWDTLHKTASFARSAVIAPDGTIFFLSGTTILRKAPAAQSWTTLMILPADPGSPLNKIKSLTLTAPGELFAATEAGIHRSTDNGSTWSAAGVGLQDSVIRAVVPAGGALLATGRDSTIYRSTDNGGSWALLPIRGKLPVVAASSAGEPVVIGMLDGRIFREQSRGGEWIVGSAPELFVTALLQIRPGVLLAGSSVHGIFRSSDGGGSWEISNRGITGSSVASIAVAPNGTIHVGLIERDSGLVYFSAREGLTWQRGETSVRIAGVWCIAALPNGTIMAGTEGSGIYRSTDNGETWTQKNAGLANLIIRSLAVKPNGVVLAGTEGAGVFQSTDNGESWTQTTLNRYQYWALAVHPDGTLLAGASSGPIHYSTDDGATWTSVSGFGATTDIQSLSVAPDGSIFATTFQSGAFRSTDVGRSWKPTAMTNRILFASVSTPTGETWVGGAMGVVRTVDGTTWDTVNSGVGHLWVSALARDSSGHLLAGTSGNGLVRSNSAFSSVQEIVASPIGASLEVVPNQVTDRATVSLALARAANVEVHLYDIRGVRRATLFEGRLGAGEHDIPWNGNLEAGIYYCVLESGGRIATARVEVR